MLQCDGFGKLCCDRLDRIRHDRVWLWLGLGLEELDKSLSGARLEFAWFCWNGFGLGLVCIGLSFGCVLLEWAGLS